MSLKSTLLSPVVKLIWNAIQTNPDLQDELIEFLLDKIPALRETATVEEVKTAIEENLEAIEANIALFTGDDDETVG